MPSAGDPGPDEVVTWHHGLMSRWWANFNLDGPEIDYFRQFVEVGQPALDAACGTGRLLVPWVADGLDVDGVDASADMIARCGEAAQRQGRTPNLYVQPLHALDLPRRYGAIVVCGGFGLGVSRTADFTALRRLFDHVRPGGVLVMDYEVGEFDTTHWRDWQPHPADESPPPPSDRRHGADGFDYALRHRLAAVDVEARRVVREMQLWQWSGGELVAHETRSVIINLYTADEIVASLTSAGFADLDVVGGYHGGEPDGSERFLVYIARRPASSG